MDVEYIEKHKIFEGIVGSRAYGLHNEDSDYDKAGIVIPGIEYFFGSKIFEQFQNYETDKCMYDIRKYIKLLTENNPNIIDVVNLPDRCVIYTSKYFEKIKDNFDLFLSKKCKFTYSGYSIQQLVRIKNHRKYLINPPKCKPERKDFGLEETSIFKSAQLKSIINIESLFDYVSEENKTSFIHELDTVYADNVIPVFRKYLSKDRNDVCLSYIQNTLQSQLNTFTILGHNGYIKDEYFEEAEKELKFENANREWKVYDAWKKGRNEKRKVYEEKYGFDLKHAATLIKLLRMGMEILETGKVNVDRTNIDAEELKAIRYDGIWTYEMVENYCNEMNEKLNVAYEKSTLQKDPQMDKINDLQIEIIDEYLKDNS